MKFKSSKEKKNIQNDFFLQKSWLKTQKNSLSKVQNYEISVGSSST